MTVYDGKVFISYSWSNQDHEQWVKDLAKQLTECGIHVELDKWDLREGHDTISFMERMVTSPEITKVIIVCDRLYAEKTDSRKGGVGTEAQIISAKIYAEQKQDKFVAVIAERDEQGNPFLPTYYKSRIYIDLSQSDRYVEEFERLVRWVYNKPVDQRPTLGKAPSYITEASGSALPGTSSLARRVIDAYRNGKDFRRGAFDEYLRAFVESTNALQLSSVEPPFDEAVVELIESSALAKQEFVNVFGVVMQYGDVVELVPKLIRMFERLVLLYEPPPHASSYSDVQFDAARFFVHEIFLCIVAMLLDEEKIDELTILLHASYHYDFRLNRSREKEGSFGQIWENAESLDQRNIRLKLGKASLRADLLKKRCEGSALSVESLMQADFVCFLNRKLAGEFWFPEMLVFAVRHHGPFKVFSRATNPPAKNQLLGLLSHDRPNVVLDGIERLTRERDIPHWDYRRFDPIALANVERLRRVN
ncbi:toll/interleukin-1 receptor domain-containing protein [Roseateles sp. L2-2]|uniref:toll/interleukin-1 receptor domain-containing protein n=1 Tax=Roseateles sp. L2-2 TaxID=3422597 RepID=UPI003D36198F